MGREKSDGRVVPEGPRKRSPIAATRGGKATTDIEKMQKAELASETAERPLSPATSDEAALVRDVDVTMEQIADEANLRRAFRRVAENRGAPGPDGRTVDTVRRELERALPRLRRSLVDGTYRPGSIRRVWIPKSGGGERGLGIPNVIDRWVQQAILQRLAPLYEPTFHPSSHGFRPERSCHTAIAEAKVHVADGRMWVVDIDLEKFFDRVPHQRLLAKLRLGIRDERILQVIGRMLRAQVVMPDGVVVTTAEGTPQGGPLSPLLSNIVLDELDRELERRGHRFVRYADDMNVYVRTESAGKRVFEGIKRFLERRMRLSVNAGKSAVSKPRGRHFLGFEIRPNVRKQRVELDVSSRTEKRLRERIRDLTPRTWGNSLRACIERVNRYFRGWAEFFGVAFWVRGLARYADAHMRRRLRSILLTHWKEPKTIRANLMKLGAPASLVNAEIGSTGRPWNLSNRQSVCRGIRNEHFERWGLLSLDALCAKRFDKGLPSPGSCP